MRIVSLSPSLTEIVIALGAGNHLVGASDACEVSQGNVERVGPPKAIQVSKIEVLSPDWIVADSRENRVAEILRLQRKWAVQLFEVKGLEEVCGAISTVGRLVEKTEEAERLNQSIREENVRNEETFPRPERKRTILLLWETPYLTVNFDTYPSCLVEAAGGINVFRDESLPEFPVEMEDFVERDPEVLLLSGEPAPFQPRHIAQFRRWRVFSEIPIHLVEGKFFTRYGVQTVEALRRLHEIYMRRTISP